ncbi:MAG: hypothetical protein Q8R08_03620 [bacterium]|nr:hypothetical protein [bacterium]
MLEDYDAREAFLQYLEENKDKPIDPRAEKAGKRELELGAKGGFAVYGDEPDKKKKFAGAPEGELYKTDMTESELRQAVAELDQAKQVFVKHLDAQDLEDFRRARKLTLLELEENRLKLPADIVEAIHTLAKYDFEGEITLFNLPEAIDDQQRKYTRIADHLHNKSVM